MKPYRIIIADDHSLIRQGIKAMIGQEAGLEVVGEVADGGELLTAMAKRLPDMVILDISMPLVNGIEAVTKIHSSYPTVRILVLTMHSDTQYFYHAVSAGAHGYLLKDDSDTELLPAIKAIQRGQLYVTPQLVTKVTVEMVAAYRNHKGIPLIHLTNREKQVLQMVVKGWTSKQMAKVLCLSPRTVDHYRSSLLKKFKMKNSVDLVNHAIKNSLIVPE